LGGLIIMGIGYKGLFWTDSATCITAILIFALLVKEKKKITLKNETVSETNEVTSVFKDKIFWLFQFVCFLTAVLFFQIFTTLPLYHH